MSRGRCYPTCPCSQGAELNVSGLSLMEKSSDSSVPPSSKPTKEPQSTLSRQSPQEQGGFSVVWPRASASESAPETKSGQSPSSSAGLSSTDLLQLFRSIGVSSLASTTSRWARPRQARSFSTMRRPFYRPSTSMRRGAASRFYGTSFSQRGPSLFRRTRRF